MAKSIIATGIIAFALALAGAFVIAGDGADAAAEPTVTWEVADAENGVLITYKTAGVSTEDEIEAVIGSDAFDAEYVIPYEYKAGKTIDDVPSGLVKYLGDKTITVPIDMYATVSTALESIVDIDVAKAKTVVEFVIPTTASLYTPAEIAALIEGLYTEEEVEEAIAIAVSIAIGEYIYTQEDVDAIIAQYADYKSPEDVQKAIDKAIEDYKAQHPAVKSDNTVLYIAIGILAVVAGLFGIIAMLGMRKAHAEGRTLF